MKKYILFSIIFFGVLFFAKVSLAATYYVSTTGSDSSPGSQFLPWKTIQKAANTMVAGDTTNVQPGNYGETVTTAANGSNGNYITFQAQGTVTTKKFIVNHNYIKIDSFSFQGLTGNYDNYISVYGDYAYISNNNFAASGTYEIHGIKTENASDHATITSNVLTGVYGYGISIRGTNHLVENNTIANHSGDAMHLWGHDHIIRGNNITNGLGHPSIHPDCFQAYGDNQDISYNILLENNWCDGIYQICMLSQDGVADIRDWTFRNNVFYNTMGLCWVLIPNVKFYNNTFYIASYAQSGGPLYFRKFPNMLCNGGEIKNNLFIASGYGDAANQGWYSLEPECTTTTDYNYVARGPSYSWAAKSGFSEAHGINGGNPQFVDYVNKNFHLQATSPAINKGTTITGFSTDKDAVSRPQGSAWDIGAYEYSGVVGPATYTLTVSKSGTGSGTITGGNISCGSTCSQTVSSGTSITLTAAANSGSTFAGWSGGGCSGTGSCTVTVSSNITVTATFNLTTDTQTPTVPTNLTATAVSSSQINLTWTASTDLVGVTGYRIYRNGQLVNSLNSITYSDTGLSPNTTYSYTVSAYDAAGNVSSQSSSASATTQTASVSGNIEAESGTLTSPMQIVTDSAASGDAYIMTSTGESGTATYSFNITTAGTYKIVARVYAQNGGTDSFYAKIDNLTEDTWDLNPYSITSEFNVWREDEVTKRGTGTFDLPQYDPYTINLTSGNHTLTFRGRETSARLDYFRLVNVGSVDTTPPAAPTGVVVN